MIGQNGHMRKRHAVVRSLMAPGLSTLEIKCPALCKAKFFLRSVQDKQTDCWNWGGKTTGRTPTQQYGVCEIMGQRYYVHRLSYVWLVGDIPAGSVIDHICRNSLCVNPVHLRLLSHTANIDYNRRKTHCKWGHPYDVNNTYYRKNRPGRRCKICTSYAGRKYYARKL